jgi:hypothetical protein
MRNLIASLLIVLGLALGVATAFIVHLVLGLAAASVALIVLGALAYDREPAT